MLVAMSEAMDDASALRQQNDCSADLRRFKIVNASMWSLHKQTHDAGRRRNHLSVVVLKLNHNRPRVGVEQLQAVDESADGAALRLVAWWEA